MPLIDMGEQGLLDVPDDASPETLQALRTKLQGAGRFMDAAKLPQPPGTLESLGRDVASGFGKSAATLARGASMLAGAFGPSDEEGRATPGTVLAPRNNPLARTLTDAADSAEDYWTQVGNRSTNSPAWQSIARGAGGAAAVSPTVQGVVTGMGGGAGEWAADRLSGENPNPLMKVAGNVVGSLATGTAWGAAARARPQTGSIAQEMMEGITPEQLQTAQAYKNQLASRGMDIDLAQALKATSGHAGNLTAVRDVLAGHRQGNTVQAIHKDQPSQLAVAGKRAIADLPGTNWSASQNANNVQEAATSALNAAKEARSRAVRDAYAQVGELPPEARSRLGAILNEAASRPGATEVLKQRAKEFGQKLSGTPGGEGKELAAAREAVATATTPRARQQAQQALELLNQRAQSAGTGPLHALDVDTWISELRGPWQGTPLKIGFPKEQGELKYLAGNLNKELQNLSPRVQAAEQLFAQITRDKINPLKQGPVGTLSQAKGYLPDTQAMVGKFTSLMDAGSDVTAKNSDIRTMARELGEVDPGAFQDAFKGWLSKKAQSAIVEAGEGGTWATADPKQFAQAMFSNNLQWQGIKDATAEMAAQHKVAPQDMVRGLENLRQMTIAMAHRPDKAGGLSAAEIRQLGEASNTANLVRILGFLPANRLGKAIEHHTFSRTLADLDKILTSREGADMLVKLGKVPVMSRTAQTILGSWGAMGGNSDGLLENNPPE